MNTEPGLRERKKRRTRAAISDAALRLFLTDGFDAVSVVDIATAAEVSKRTLFQYFPSKEDLVVHRFADHIDDAARVVRDRARGQTPLEALHTAFRAGLDTHEPATGLCDTPEVVACYRLMLDTPALTARLAHFLGGGEIALAGTLGPPDDLDARLAASAITAVRGTLCEANWREMAAGRTAAQRHPVAVAEADRAFELLAEGFARTLRPPRPAGH
ncbi:TetR family transcriptional regulator [Nocardia sp. NPDC004568]|uniref:TetR/AcrR family transcriptional regulator n=1 Tax=Nocardia sp. NPDC004568 TaxID=3154551 RepID=UPI0033BDF31B